MKIKNIKLTNIGPYIGTNNVFEFSTDSFQPVTLVGGKNGAGKTTLLKTLKIGLFGSYSYGISTDGTSYLNKVKELFNYRVMNEENAQFAIEVTMLLNEGLDINEYVIRRKWNKTGKKYLYQESVVLNDVILSKERVFSFMSKLKEVMPPNMIDSILFDGEEIAKIVSEDQIPNYLRELFVSCYNINLFEKLDSDLLIYSEKEAGNEVTTKDQQKLIEKQKEIDKIKLEIKHISSDLVQKKNDMSMMEDSISALDGQFKGHNGITKTKRVKYEKLVKKIEELKYHATKEMKDYLEHDFVFSMNKDLLEGIVKDVEKSKPTVYINYIQEVQKYLPNANLSGVLDELETRISHDCIGINPLNIQLTESLLEKHNSKTNRYYQKKLSTMMKSSGEYKEVKELLDFNEGTNEIQNLYDEIIEMKKKLIDEQAKYVELEEALNHLQGNLAKAIEDFNQIERKVMNQSNENSSFKIAMDVRKVVQRFVEEQTKSKVNYIENTAKDKFEEVNKKVDYVKRMEIDPETFEITLYDFEDMKMSINLLSAGEKQILLASIVWVLFKSAKRDDIFIFDTPLARLDSENRELYIRNIITTISSQVILLSTDEEFIGANLEIIEPFVGQSYVLQNNPTAMKTEIIKGYF